MRIENRLVELVEGNVWDFLRRVSKEATTLQIRRSTISGLRDETP
jgi:hypothetical protein